MKKIERIRAMEAARVCLIEAEKLLKTAKERLLEAHPKNDRIRNDFEMVIEQHNRILVWVVDEQESE